jgi:hypothetical protein
VLIGLVAMGIVVAILRVPGGLGVWVLGSPLAVVFGLLAAKVVSVAGVESWPPQLDTLKLAAFTAMDTAGVVGGFILAAVATESRFTRRLRLWLPLSALGTAAVMWTMFYLVSGR